MAIVYVTDVRGWHFECETSEPLTFAARQAAQGARSIVVVVAMGVAAWQWRNTWFS